MKKSVVAVVVFALILIVSAGILYTRDERTARSVAGKALSDLQSAGHLDLYKRQESRSAWVQGVRTLEGDAAAEIRRAATPESGEAAGLALLEAAGAKTKCNLTGGVIPVAGNPWRTETLAAHEILALAKSMAAKGSALAAAGRFEDAQKELFLLLSVGDHLAEDSSLHSFALGLSVQETALEALLRLYAARGEAMAKEVRQAGDLRDALRSKRKALSSVASFMDISMTAEGRRWLKDIAEDRSLDRAIRSEAITALSAGHLLHIHRVVFGPEADRKAIMSGLRLEDPVLAEISAKAQETTLTMSINERKEALSYASAMR
jgi:hypothetical protein